MALIGIQLETTKRNTLPRTVSGTVTLTVLVYCSPGSKARRLGTSSRMKASGRALVKLSGAQLKGYDSTM